ncbi:hypothetical protein KKD84_04510 [Patescibacteria group bacterium]|nr:hypothetical protein [Patescibacteria group bacterium]
MSALAGANEQQSSTLLVSRPPADVEKFNKGGGALGFVFLIKTENGISVLPRLTDAMDFFGFMASPPYTFQVDIAR